MTASRGRTVAAALAIVSVFAAVGGGACSDPRRAESSSAPADSAAGELGFRWVGPGGAAIVVPVRFNGGEPVDLILDSGATLTCVDSSLARELALPEQQGIRGGAIGVGGTGRVDLHTVDSLQIGGAVARGLTVCAMNLDALRTVDPEVRGLLGLNALRGFRVTLDFERDILRLAPPGE